MGLVITRPVVRNGQISSSDWLGSTGKVVDAQMIAANFRYPYAEWNGNLHGSNLEYASFQGGVIGEYQVKFPENLIPSTYGPVETVVQNPSHSHDGRDSSFLAPSAVDIAVTKYRSFEAYQCPSRDRTMFLMSGKVELDQFNPSAYNSWLVDLPCDIFDTTLQSSGIMRCSCQLEISNPILLNNKFGLPFGIVEASNLGSQVPYLRISMRVGVVPKKTSGVRIHWLVFALRA